MLRGSRARSRIIISVHRAPAISAGFLQTVSTVQPSTRRRFFNGKEIVTRLESVLLDKEWHPPSDVDEIQTTEVACIIYASRSFLASAITLSVNLEFGPAARYVEQQIVLYHLTLARQVLHTIDSLEK